MLFFGFLFFTAILKLGEKYNMNSPPDEFKQQMISEGWDVDAPGPFVLFADLNTSKFLEKTKISDCNSFSFQHILYPIYVERGEFPRILVLGTAKTCIEALWMESLIELDMKVLDVQKMFNSYNYSRT